ncbi:MAG: hypothetical protein KJ749_01945 [Planctomycetes bacterium]|nr:hypothetical protein [Planctomycetota bacterium]
MSAVSKETSDFGSRTAGRNGAVNDDTGVRTAGRNGAVNDDTGRGSIGAGGITVLAEVRAERDGRGLRVMVRFVGREDVDGVE